MHVFMCECTVCYIRLVLYLQFNKPLNMYKYYMQYTFMNKIEKALFT